MKLFRVGMPFWKYSTNVLQNLLKFLGSKRLCTKVIHFRLYFCINEKYSRSLSSVPPCLFTKAAVTSQLSATAVDYFLLSYCHSTQLLVITDNVK